MWLTLLLLHFVAVSPLVNATAIIIVTVATTVAIAAIAVVQRIYNCFHAMLPYMDTASILLKCVY